MKIKPTALALLAASLLALPASAQAAGFEIEPGSVAVSAENADGTPDNLASSHPYAFSVSFKLKTDESGRSLGGEMRDAILDLPPGWVGDPLAVPRCPRARFEGFLPDCPLSTQVGLVTAISPGLGELYVPLFNLVPPPGVPAQFGFSSAKLVGLPAAELRTEDGYAVRASTPNLPLEVTAITAKIWGVPANSGHDPERGNGQDTGGESGEPETAFLTLPADCSGPMRVTVSVDSKLAPGAFSTESAAAAAPLTGCDSVPFAPQVSSQTSSRLASSGSGLDFELRLPEHGLHDPGAIAETEPHKMEVTLPEGVTANPSLAEGIGVCTKAQYESEQLETAPGAGCPEASKLGSIVAHSPLLNEPILGSLYLATPYENPGHSLIGLYLVARASERGVLVKQTLKVSPEAQSGRLVTTIEEMPPLPYSDVVLHFREGARSALVTPPRCGTFATTAKLYPFSAPDSPYRAEATFKIERGADGGACPAGGEPFHPGFEAGTTNNQAGAYSPFYMRLTRQDGDQDLTRFSAKLPPGVIGRLAGTAQCSDAQIAHAAARQGEHGGEEEKADPSCPADSQIGRAVAGAGVGGALVYVPGRIYLAGPYHGAPLSVVAIVPALAGPFDAGTVVTRQALRIDPLTVEVEADGSSSDPIPHILKGIPLKVRDLRVYVDKPDFTLNPTSCEPSATKATIWGGGANVFSSADDTVHALEARFQAASCASLGFKPKLGLKLRGGTRRGAHPALRGVFSPRRGNANTRKLVLRLPHSAFLEQGHIRTICTRVQFRAGGGNGEHCPKAAIYGRAKAWTPILDEPVEGPVYLRSSNHNLPDFVAALHGIVDVEAVARIDSKKGGIRATFNQIPDVPLSRVIVNMQGGKKGLIVNSKNLCYRPKRNRANAQFTGHNGRREGIKPLLRPTGCKQHRRKRHRTHRSGR